MYSIQMEMNSKKHIHRIFGFFGTGRLRLLFVLFLMSFGCASLPEVYIPKQIGSISDPRSDSAALRVEIQARDQWVRMGESVVFQVRILNQSDQPFWIPVEPELVFLWVYPNGVRDNHVRDVSEVQHYLEDDVIRIEPGDAHEVQTKILTDFFPRTGIVEFRALLHVPRNTNPRIAPFCSGWYMSNRYGVYVDRA